jgi:AAA family ATP:ADP antiporter
MGLIAIYRNWTYAIFFELAELWGSFMLALMFWGFSNEITKVKEAKRFYAMFGIGANLALLVAGWATVYVSDIRQSLPKEVDAWGLSLNYLMVMVVLCCIGIMATYWWINRYVLTDSRYYDPSDEIKKNKDKPKLTLKESFYYLAQSPYIGFLAILVIGYGVSINIVEVTWKSQLKLQYPDSNDYSTFMGYFTSMTGVASLIMLFVGGAVIKGVPLMLAIGVGTFQNIVSKSCKYSLFDPTKEMAYIPLDQEQKVKGKASIDVVGARLGKAGGAAIQQGLIFACGTMAEITPYLACILIGVISVWIVSVHAINKRFTALTLAPKN